MSFQFDPQQEATMLKAFRFVFVLTTTVAVSANVRGEDWPQWMGPKRDDVWRETGILDSFPKNGAKVLWRTKLSGGYAGPAVAGGRVYHFDYDTDGNYNTDGFPTKLTGKERILCLDATTGKEVWKYEYECNYNLSYPAGPRCTPTVSGGKVYALGAMGDLTVIDATSGKKVWSKNLPGEYKARVPMWGYSGHPLVDGNRLYVTAGGKDTIAVALDKDAGQELWHALGDAEIGYSPPTMIKAGGVYQLLIWHTKAINALDPKTGQVYWSLPLDTFAGMSIMPPRPCFTSNRPLRLGRASDIFSRMPLISSASLSRSRGSIRIDRRSSSKAAPRAAFPAQNRARVRAWCSHVHADSC